MSIIPRFDSPINKPPDPDAIIIYIHDGECHSIGANLKAGKWKYSKWVIFPEHELNEFLGWRMNNGAHILDFRLQAKWHTPGMEKATPIIVAQNNIPLKDALEACKILHQAILDSPDDDSEGGAK